MPVAATVAVVALSTNTVSGVAMSSEPMPVPVPVTVITHGKCSRRLMLLLHGSHTEPSSWVLVRVGLWSSIGAALAIDREGLSGHPAQQSALSVSPRRSSPVSENFHVVC